MRVGLFGGSFDPIHRGHVLAASAARREAGLERVLFLPTAQPPHKPGRAFAPALARYAMVEIALLGDPNLAVSAHELTLGRPAYTVETLESFRAAEPNWEIALLLGADSLFELITWRRWRDLLESTPLVVLARPGYRREEHLEPLAPEIERAIADGRVTFVDNPPHPASSTEIRRRLAAGTEIPADWLDPAVLRYLEKYALYR